MRSISAFRGRKMSFVKLLRFWMLGCLVVMAYPNVQAQVLCGNGICDAAGGENCSSCAADCKCATGQSCAAGLCQAATTCEDGNCETTRHCQLTISYLKPDQPIFETAGPDVQQSDTFRVLCKFQLATKQIDWPDCDAETARKIANYRQQLDQSSGRYSGMLDINGVTVRVVASPPRGLSDFEFDNLWSQKETGTVHVVCKVDNMLQKYVDGSARYLEEGNSIAVGARVEGRELVTASDLPPRGQVISRQAGTVAPGQPGVTDSSRSSRIPDLQRPDVVDSTPNPQPEAPSGERGDKTDASSVNAKGQRIDLPEQSSGDTATVHDDDNVLIEEALQGDHREAPERPSPDQELPADYVKPQAISSATGDSIQGQAELPVTDSGQINRGEFPAQAGDAGQPTSAATAENTLQQGPQVMTPKVDLQVWRWDEVAQKGTWGDGIALDKRSTLKLRWRPAVLTGEAGHWELRAGLAGGSFENAEKVDNGLVELPSTADGWQGFDIDLAKYMLKGPPDKYYVIVRHATMNSQTVLATISTERASAEESFSADKVTVTRVSPDLITAIFGPVAKTPVLTLTPQPNHIEVTFSYRFTSAPGGEIYPSLLSAAGTVVSTRNYWEVAPLKGTKGEVTSRMALTCPSSNSPFIHVAKVHYTVTNSTGGKVMTGVAELPREYVFLCPYTKNHDGDQPDRFDIRFTTPPDMTSGTISLKPSAPKLIIKYDIWATIPAGEEVYHRIQVIRDGNLAIPETGEWFKIWTLNNVYASSKLGYSGRAYVSCDPPGSASYVPTFRVTAIRELFRKGSPENGPVVASATYPTDIMVKCE